jgi:hypothetical protein
MKAVAWALLGVAVLVGAKEVIGYTAVQLGVFEKPAKVSAKRGVTAS